MITIGRERTAFAIIGWTVFIVLLFAIFAACWNDAISYAHLVAPDAECQALNTSYMGPKADTATCRVGKKIYSCTSEGPHGPECTAVADVIGEAR